MNMKYIQVLLVLSLVPRYYIVHSYARLCTQKQMCSYMCYVPAKLPGDPRENHEYKFLNQRWQSLEKKFFCFPQEIKETNCHFFRSFLEDWKHVKTFFEILRAKNSLDYDSLLKKFSTTKLIN